MTAAKPVIFPYKLLGGRWSPLISAGIQWREKWQPVEFYVDSGATYTILRARIAADAGLDFASGRKVFAQVGDGSLIPVYLHDLRIQIGGTQIRAPVGFSEKLGVAFNLLGRLGVFEHFRICFHEKQKTVSFLPVK
jgi:hypothetical protein